MAGKRLPIEAEWEFAARGGLTGKVYAWGDELRPNGKWMANSYQGQFPVKEQSEDASEGVAKVAQYPTNGYGLYDIAGNVWEWCSDWYRPDYNSILAAADPVARNPQGPDASAGSAPRFCLSVHHTDAEREWLYDRQSSIGRLDKRLDEAKAKGWTIVSMKDDWIRIFSFEKQ